ncbi:VOC family protein [Elizabethkingia meningoseptica]|uniref:bleomycin resistance protein n=1 Tax=Elizabethkingia meningoseptica TaxID=238 RepID=UPI0023B0FAEB|nr:VOC family protein [Elizabethkingia meningoseptica]MDE5438647.1 VOC family protein [Elizabethkingia meningoseptica]MDE5507782.1 VOC family protein [Elizabethkingia meningoseptica]MDE5516373.1 VOC family protein [Elizabethkingia meningoseptica]MDE5530683.1 VOC family protein [Elizabethkingia meningoseptica]MDE5534240.1 VOC family protein [Elizabethkingia meningoseptica]
MFTEVHPKLPMRNRKVSHEFYVKNLLFEELGDPNFEPYMMVRKDAVEIHFFEFKDINPLENDGQIYIRVNNIDELYQSYLERNIAIHPNGHMAIKPYGQKEFSILYPDNNLITFGQSL